VGIPALVNGHTGRQVRAVSVTVAVEGVMEEVIEAAGIVPSTSVTSLASTATAAPPATAAPAPDVGHAAGASASSAAAENYAASAATSPAPAALPSPKEPPPAPSPKESQSAPSPKDNKPSSSEVVAPAPVVPALKHASESKTSVAAPAEPEDVIHDDVAAELGERKPRSRSTLMSTFVVLWVVYCSASAVLTL